MTNLEGIHDYLQLPPDSEMDALVVHFFSDTGALFPFVHGPSFKETYELVKRNSFRKTRRSWLGLLNAILAMATVTSASWSVTATDRAAKAEIYYMRAKALCLDQMLHNASLETGRSTTDIYYVYSGLTGSRLSTSGVAHVSIFARHSSVHHDLEHPRFGCQGSLSAGPPHHTLFHEVLSIRKGSAPAHMVWMHNARQVLILTIRPSTGCRWSGY